MVNKCPYCNNQKPRRYAMCSTHWANMTEGEKKTLLDASGRGNGSGTLRLVKDNSKGFGRNR